MRRGRADAALALLMLPMAALLGVGAVEPGISAIVLIGRLSGALGMLLYAWLYWNRHRHGWPRTLNVLAGALVTVSVAVYLTRLG